MVQIYSYLTIISISDKIHSILCIQGEEKMSDFNPRDHVGLLIKFLNGRISNKVNKNLLQFNLTGVQHEILCFIDRNERKRDVFQKDIEKCLKLTNPTVTGIVKRLEEKKLIVRCPSTDDARYKCLHLTKQGQEVICKSLKFGATHIEGKLTEGMTDEDIKMFKYLLNKSLDNME